jgi:hypothetical protein
MHSMLNHARRRSPSADALTSSEWAILLALLAVVAVVVVRLIGMNVVILYRFATGAPL